MGDFIVLIIIAVIFGVLVGVWMLAFLKCIDVLIDLLAAEKEKSDG